MFFIHCLATPTFNSRAINNKLLIGEVEPIGDFCDYCDVFRSPCGCVTEVVCFSLCCAGVMWVGVLLCVGVVGVGVAGDLPLNLPSFEGGGGVV